MSKKALTIERESNVRSGFQQETMQATQIAEGAGVDGALLNKLGTSIPTPFARLHLFHSAFLEVNANGRDAGANYRKIISLALDMLEFLYLNGASSSMEILKWNVDEQTNFLNNSTSKHQRFGATLNSCWTDNNYTGRDIYLFSYKNNLIGGTSPLSLVYTSPNISETYQGLSRGHQLFDTTDPVDLIDRELEFRLYIYKLWKTFYVQFSSGLLGSSLTQYISNTFNKDVEETPIVGQIMNQFSALADPLKELLNPTDGSQTLKKIPLGGGYANLGDGSIPLLVKDLSNVAFKSDYVIKNTVDYFKNYEVNGQAKIMPAPLVLNKDGIGARYVNETYWINGSIPPSDASIAPYDRILPNTEIKYPYLMAEDLMQDKIIEVSYDIQKSKFQTGLPHNTKYLLPLKSEFFKYFKPEDLDGMLKIEEETDNMTGAVTKVTVYLTIPLKGGRDIALSKEYSDENNTIVHTYNGEVAFNIGIFPFFVDISNIQSAGHNVNLVSNEYDVLLLNKAENAKLEFFNTNKPDYKFQNVFKDSNSNILGEISEDIRSTKNKVGYESKYYHINKPFDAIEVSVKANGIEGSGLVLPLMRKVESDTYSNSFTFGVDFGTTNTQVAYSKNPSEPVKTFSISINGASEDESQTVFLNDHEVIGGNHLLSAGFGTMEEMDTVARQEFIAPEVPTVTFPMRTSVCEIDNLSTKTSDEIHLFGSINIGFNYANELVKDQNAKSRNRYVTNLKWDYAGDPKSYDRIRNFFQELLLMMRNKAVLNNGTRNIKVVVTYPQAMNGGDRRNFKDAWKEAAKNIGLDPNNIDFQYESIAPYYSFSRKKGLNHIYVNMDIGGGSTDIIYLNPATGGDKMTYSVLFAANDIWGDGCNVLMQGGQNGFLVDYERSKFFNSKPDTKKNEYQRVKSRANDSSNIINYLFKNDTTYEFSRFIKGSSQILLPLLHYTALIYYMSLIIEAHDLAYPKTISFTGMGSKYLNLLGTDEELAKLSDAIMDYAREKEDSRLSILFADNPKEVTAEGAVIIQTAVSRGIPLINPESWKCYGVLNEEHDTKVYKKDIEENEYRNDILSHYEKIVDMMLKDNRFRSMVSQLGFSTVLNALPSKAEFMNIFTDSYNAYQQIYIRKHNSDNADALVEESMFFWPLKNGLYQLGEKLSNQQ